MEDLNVSVFDPRFMRHLVKTAGDAEVAKFIGDGVDKVKSTAKNIFYPGGYGKPKPSALQSLSPAPSKATTSESSPFGASGKWSDPRGKTDAQRRTEARFGKSTATSIGRDRSAGVPGRSVSPPKPSQPAQASQPKPSQPAQASQPKKAPGRRIEMPPMYITGDAPKKAPARKLRFAVSKSVMAEQRRLKAAGLYKGRIDGQAGRQTRAARAAYAKRPQGASRMSVTKLRGAGPQKHPARASRTADKFDPRKLRNPYGSSSDGGEEAGVSRRALAAQRR
jgi:hypothetical protein